MFCRNCGQTYTTPEAVICVKCGAPKGDKSKILAGLLGIFLGCFGVHNFYLGYTSKAVIQLVLTIVSFPLMCIGIGVLLLMGIEIWGLVEGIMILCGKIERDANGRLLSD